MLHVTAAERKAPPAPRFHPDGTMRATPGRRSIAAMAGKRSPEFIAVPMVAIAVVYAAVLFWAVTADTGLAWTIFVLANAAVIVLALVLVARRRGPRSLPAEAETARSSADGIYRPLVLVDAEGAVPRLREEIVRSAAGRPAEAFVVAPALSSRLDWLTGDQAAYDRASAELDEAVAALEAAGIGAQAQIGAHDPLQAAADGLREFPAEAIVVVTGTETSWLEDGLLETLERRTAIPVTHVVVD